MAVLLRPVEITAPQVITQPVTPFYRDGSSLDSDVDVLDSDEFDTDLEDEKGKEGYSDNLSTAKFNVPFMLHASILRKDNLIIWSKHFKTFSFSRRY